METRQIAGVIVRMAQLPKEPIWSEPLKLVAMNSKPPTLGNYATCMVT